MADVAAETQSAASPATEAPLGRADQHDDGEDSAPRNGRRSRDRYGRDRRGNRTERSPREEQQPDAALEDSTPIEIVLPVAAAHLAPADDNAADDAAPRRRSYFADVRPETGTQSAPAPASEPAAVAVAVAAAVPTEANAPVAESAPASIAEASPAEMTAISEPISTEMTAEEAQTAPEKEAPAVAMVAAAEATATAQPAPASTYHLPIEQLSALAQAAGLQWVQSDAEKIAAVQAAIAAEPAPIRIPRERPAPVVLDDAPLILVETRKDLADLRLPFETHNTAS